jgi:hypothetical protein
MAVAVDSSANRCHIDGENSGAKVIDKFCTVSGILACEVRAVFCDVIANSMVASPQIDQR